LRPPATVARPTLAIPRSNHVHDRNPLMRGLERVLDRSAYVIK